MENYVAIWGDICFAPNILRHDSGGSLEGATSGMGHKRGLLRGIEHGRFSPSSGNPHDGLAGDSGKRTAR
jgi:hypothetical protein